MATGRDIQLENGGYTRIHNAILEALARMPLRGQQLRCVLFLLRKTYGYGRKEDKISLNQWAEGTGMKRQNVWRELHSLIQANVIHMESNGVKRPATWRFNKYIEQWRVESVIADDDSSVITGDYSDEKSVIADDDSSVITGDYSDEKSVIAGDDKSVITPHESTKERKKVVVASSPVPAPPAPPAETAPAAATEPKAPEPRDPWITDYETIWGMVVPSPYVAAQIDEWKARVPQSAWQHALQESLKANARNWRYLGRILERLERDGPPTPVTVPTPGPDLSFSLENLQ